MKKYIIFMLCVAFMGCMAASTEGAEETVKVVLSTGDVRVIPSGETKAVACRPGMQLKEGSRIITGEEAAIEIAFDKPGRNIVKVKANSEVVVKLDGADKIELIDGEIYAHLQNLKVTETFRVKTPCAICGARGTGWSVKTDKVVTNVAVFEGRVFVRGIKKDGSAMDKEYWIEKGFERKIRRLERPDRLQKISEARLSRMEKEFRRPARKEARERIIQKAAKREELIEKRVEKREETIEQRQESVVERKDDKKIEQVTSGASIRDK